MSLSLILIPMAVAVVTTASVKVATIIENKNNIKDNSIKNIETIYTNVDLLVKTLQEHGVLVECVSSCRVIATFSEGRILYRRNTEVEPFVMDIEDVKNIEDLVCSIDMLETEYGLNVQSYTYDRVMNNLPENMYIESEQVLEDNSILITLTVE